MNPRQCEFCDTELPPQAEYDACDDCIKRMSELINEPPVRTLQPNDDWGHCTRCGCATNDADVWREFCPRCQQLADLEREIGRAVIAEALLYEAAQDLPCIERDALSLLQNLQMAALSETDPLIAQWRKLHAEGAEAEAATERQEDVCIE